MASSQIIIPCDKTGKVTNCCRVCGTSSSYQMSIFNEEGPEHDLATKINKYLPIEVRETDTLPLTICCQCASSLISWHQLVIGCVKADEMFKKQAASQLDDADLKNEMSVDNEPELEANGSEGKELMCQAGTASNVQGSIKLEGVTQDSNCNVGYTPCIKSDTIFESNEQTELKCENKLEKQLHFTEKPCKSLVENGSSKLESSECGSNRPIYECAICGKILASRENLKIHFRIHTGEKPYTCHICGKQFLAHSGIKRHLKEVHEGVRDQMCNICGRGFANKRTLEDHSRIHTGERPFVCDLCGKTFRTPASLYVHKKCHLDVFPFKCNSCEKNFRTQTALSLHILKHTGEKPHPCDICGRCFRVKHELNKHKLIHSDQKPFACDKCPIKFKQIKYLRNHIKNHHRADQAETSVSEEISHATIIILP